MNVIAFRAADRRPAHGGYPDPPAPGQYEPCPFCEGEFPIMLTRDHAGHVVICTSCSAMGPTRGTADEAIAAWNKRVERGTPQ
jgi:Lar family restriction alleviation protein